MAYLTCLTETLRFVPILDIAGWFLIWLVTFQVWQQAKPSEFERDVQQRTLGAQATFSQLTGTITASTIVLGTIGAVSAIGADKIPPATAWHFVWATVAAVFALVCGVWCLAIVPAQIRTRDVSCVRSIALFSVSALSLFVIAAVRLALGFWHFLLVREVAALTL